MSAEDEKLTAEDLAAAALIDRELPGMGRDIVAAAKAMFEAEHGPDAYANATAPRRAHYRFLATLALRPAIKRLISERDEAREALRPFEEVFEARRDFYSRRHSDRDLGYANFDKMPDDWPMEKVILTMGDFRRARAARSPKPAKSEGE